MPNYTLVKTPQHLELVAPNTHMKPLYIDFLAPQLNYRRRCGGGLKELLAKAIGVTGNKKPLVIDTTAGFGVDAFILASLGCNVYMLERSPIIAALLADGLQRALQDPWFQKLQLQLISKDAIHFLQNQLPPTNNVRQVIYLDPMYPTKTKSALNSKSMRVLRELVGEDLDAPLLLDTALTWVKSRIVVKRPRLAPILNQITPTLNFVGKSCRFDVYLT